MFCNETNGMRQSWRVLHYLQGRNDGPIDLPCIFSSSLVHIGLHTSVCRTTKVQPSKPSRHFYAVAYRWKYCWLLRQRAWCI